MQGWCETAVQGWCETAVQGWCETAVQSWCETAVQGWYEKFQPSKLTGVDVMASEANCQSPSHPVTVHE